MLFAPKGLGNRRLDPAVLAKDKKQCQKIGPCGIGKEALYLNSFFIDRNCYVTYTDVRRCYKRVAMSRGGYSGKGLFGSMPYLVVELSNGLEKQCNFRTEGEVDRFLAVLHEQHPDIPLHSCRAQQRLDAAEAEERAKYVKNLSDTAQHSIHELERARNYLEQRPGIGAALSKLAKQKRSVDGIRRSNMAAAVCILAASIAMAIVGIAAWPRSGGAWPKYLLLFGFAGIFFTLSAGILPTARHNRRTVQADWEKAVQDAADYIASYDGAGAFPVPAQYAHPIVLERMIRVIRQGRAQEIGEAFTVMEEELRSLDHTKTVSRKEYDEVVAVKPMFLVMDYQ